MRYIRPKRKIPPSSTGDFSSVEDRFFKYFISYVILIAYVLATVFSTTDLMLLQSTDGMILPFVDVKVSIVGFYVAAPFFVAAASIFMAREFFFLSVKKGRALDTGFVFSTLKSEPSRKIFGIDGKLDSIVLRLASYGMFFTLGPLVLLAILVRFSDYQDGFVFFVQTFLFLSAAYFSWVFYRRLENNFGEKISPLAIRVVASVFLATVVLKIIVCIDVIYIPAKYSLVMGLKQKYTFLDDVDGGTISFVPHIKIDRATRVWVSNEESYKDIYMYNNNNNAREYFFSRVAGVDLRERSLKYLDISFQVAPRIWAHDADLSGANLNYTRMPGSNFINTNLYGANLSLSVLDGSRFLSTNMDMIKASNSYFRGVSFDSISLSNTFFSYSNFTGSSFFGVEIKNSLINGVDFSGVVFFETIMDNNSMVIDSPSPIFPFGDSDNNNLNEFSEAFFQDENSALSSISKQFCKKELSISDEIALMNISSIYLMLDRVYPGRLANFSKALAGLSCNRAVDFVNRLGGLEERGM